MKCKSKTLTILILSLFFTLSFLPNIFAHTITVPTNAYFGFGTGHYLHFSTAKTFDSISRDSSNIWHFDNNYLLGVEDGDATVIELLENKVTIQTTTTVGATSITKVAITTLEVMPTLTINTGEGTLDGYYDATTKITSAHVTHAVATVTVTFDYGTSAPPSHGGSTPEPTSPISGATQILPGVYVSALLINLGTVQQGTVKQFFANVSWVGAFALYINGITFNGTGNEWLKTSAHLPLLAERNATDSIGTAIIPMTLTVPSNGRLGSYSLLVEYKVGVGGSQSYPILTNITFYVSATPVSPIGIPTIMTVFLLFALLGVVALGFKKYK